MKERVFEESIRDHDRLYLNENRKYTPKEYFKFIGDHVSDSVGSLEKPMMVDVGCAAGDFAYYLGNRFPQACVTGIDIMPCLLEKARTENPEMNFLLADICDKSSLPSMKFDFAFMCGVHMIFDEPTDWLENFVNLLRPSGRGFVFGMFNPEDIDCLIRVRPSGSTGPWQRGWNLVSITTMKHHLDQLSCRYEFSKWTIGIDLPRHSDDALRSWTFKDEHLNRLIVNGSQLLHPLHLLEIIHIG